MNEYRASIVYNPYTLRRLNATVSATFRYGLKMIYVGICLVLLFLGARAGLQTAQGVAFICIACFLLPSVRAIDKSRAEQTIRQLNGKTIKVEYRFDKGQFSCENASEKSDFKYKDVVRLVEDNEFFYIFPNATQAYMIDRSTLTGGNADGFKTFIKNEVGLEWTKPPSLISFNLKQLRFNKKNTRLPH